FQSIFLLGLAPAAKPGQSLVSVFYKHTNLAFGANAIFSRWVWISYLPPKVQFFGWLAWRYKVKTLVFLQHLGILGRDSSTLCTFWKSQQESIDHVLIFCPMVWRVWSELLQWWGVVWVVPGSIQGLFQWWAGHSCRNEARRIWSAIPLVTLWSLWKHKNECIFQGTQPQLQDLHELIVTRLAFWFKAASKSSDLHSPCRDLGSVLICTRVGVGRLQLVLF
ncbi:uncharacterized protein LOC114304806, partial [Camellia sinensis]|uniref:uncharacterized protein LOC114304806 n=1 Tax=Camellia sinensis TaxID=4442 RepID=UPI0010367EA4